MVKPIFLIILTLDKINAFTLIKYTASLKGSEYNKYYKFKTRKRILKNKIQILYFYADMTEENLVISFIEAKNLRRNR